MLYTANTTKFILVLLAIVAILLLTGYTQKIQTEVLSENAFIVKHRIIAPGIELDEEEGEYEEFREIEEVAQEKCAALGKKHLFVHKTFHCLKISCLRFDHIYRCADESFVPSLNE